MQRLCRSVLRVTGAFAPSTADDVGDEYENSDMDDLSDDDNYSDRDSDSNNDDDNDTIHSTHSDDESISTFSGLFRCISGCGFNTKREFAVWIMYPSSPRCTASICGYLE